MDNPNPCKLTTLTLLTQIKSLLAAQTDVINTCTYHTESYRNTALVQSPICENVCCSTSQNIRHHSNQTSLWLIAEKPSPLLLVLSMKHIFTERCYLTDRDQPQAVICVTKREVDCERGSQQVTLTNIWKHHGSQLSWIHTWCDTYAKHLQSVSRCLSIFLQHSVRHVEPAVITLQFV